MVHTCSQVFISISKMARQSKETNKTNPYHYLKFSKISFQNSTSESQKNINPLYSPTFLKNPCGSRCQNFKITPISTPRFLEILCGSPPRKSKNLCGILSEFLKNLYVVDRPNFVFSVRPLFLYCTTKRNKTQQEKTKKIKIFTHFVILFLYYIYIQDKR